MSTVHNPSQFNPADYTVIDYADAKRPQLMPHYDNPLDALEDHKREVAFWEADMLRLFGQGWQQKIHRCVHCGHNNLRWITCVEYKPTGERLVFGADCTARLGFTDKQAFKLAQLKRKADCFAAALKVATQVEKFLGDHPEVKAIYGVINNPEHVKNAFVRDVLGKLARYGSISEKQIAAIVSSIQKDIDFAARKAQQATEPKAQAPVGNGVTIAGEVVSVKEYASDYAPGGFQLKMTIKVTTPQGVWLAWGSVPSAIHDVQRGQSVSLVANTLAGKDANFVLFKRPRLAQVLAQGVA